MAHTHVTLLDIPDLDDDHLSLGHIIAELELCGENNASISVVAKVVRRLIEAARRHFAREEEMMARDEYPLLDRHRESHHELIESVEGLAGRLSAGRITVNKELIAVLWEWEIGHIDTADREYADYVKTRKIGPDTPV